MSIGRKPQQTGVVNDWRCRYDLQTGKFDVPPLFSDHNAKAVSPWTPGTPFPKRAEVTEFKI
jgi:hypothetical protein